VVDCDWDKHNIPSPKPDSFQLEGVTMDPDEERDCPCWTDERKNCLREQYKAWFSAGCRAQAKAMKEAVEKEFGRYGARTKDSFLNILAAAEIKEKPTHGK
jgi:hypothetical protein